MIIIKPLSKSKLSDLIESKEDFKQFLLPIISKMQEDIPICSHVQARAYMENRRPLWKMDSLLIQIKTI